MHHLLSVPILTIENYFHSQVTAFFMRTKKVLNSVSQKSRIDEIFMNNAKKPRKHSGKSSPRSSRENLPGKNQIGRKCLILSFELKMEVFFETL